MDETILEILKEKSNLLEFGNKEEWHSQRGKGIGGSDISAILGYSQYSSPYKIYADKVGIGERFEGNLATELGTFLEPFIRTKFCGLMKIKENIDATVIEVPYVLESKEFYFARANLDGIVAINGEYCVLEIKTASEMSTDKWKDDEVPDEYYFQVQWYMAITGFKKAYICYLIGNRKIDYKEIPRNEEIIERMMKDAKLFWEENVLKKEPPMFSWQDKEAIEALYSEENPGETINIEDEEIINIISKWRKLEEQKKKIDQEIEECKNIVKATVGNAETAYCGTAKITWKTQKKEGYFVQPSQTRVLRYSEAKIKK